MYPQIKASLPEVLDSSIISEFVACETKGYYSHMRKLGPKDPSIDLLAGGAFARGLEIIRKSFYGDKLSLSSSLERGMVEAMAFYGEPVVPEYKEAKGINRVITALAAYVEKYPPATDHIQPHFGADGQPLVEFTFSIPLPIPHPETGNPFIYAGRFDMVGVYNGQIIGVDEKTTSQLGATWSAKWNLRAQFTGYCWALQEYKYPVVGMIARGISFLKNSHGFEESIQMRPKWMIDQWYENMLSQVRRMSTAWQNGWYQQDFGDACASYGSCPFMKLCQSATPEAWIEGNFGIRDWNPLDKVPEKVISAPTPVETVNVMGEIGHLLGGNTNGNA